VLLMGVTHTLAAEAVYEAIRLARPGGLEAASQYDVHGSPPQNLLDAMRHASSYDQIARQYVHPFETVFTKVADRIEAGRQSGCSLTDAIVRTHVELLASEPDSLIARKCGAPVAEEASARAARVLDRGDVNYVDYLTALADFDFWLRSDHHRRNPGTTADLIAAGLFVLLRDERIAAPYR
jgi:triphosphoribosyl-dephospho-CoA synthase